MEKEKAKEAPKHEASVKLTAEVADRIDEVVAKAAEKVTEAQKKLKFHGAEESGKGKAVLNKLQEKKQAAEFIKAVATGNHQVAKAMSDARADQLGWSAQEKAITIAGDAGSDYLVPTVFEAEILETFDNYDEIIRDADVRTFNRPGHIFSLNELDSRVVVWPADEDSTGLTASQPTYSQPQIAIADWIGATDITLDFLEDTEVNIMADLSRQFGEEFAKKLQARLINGDVTISGVVTKGVLNSTGLNQVAIDNTTGGYTTVAANDIEEAYFDSIAIDHFQRENLDGKWYMNPTALFYLRSNIRSSSSDRDYLSIFDPAQMTLMGRPLVLTNQMPTPTTTVSDPFVLYGKLSNHLKIRRKRGITMKLNDQGTTRAGRNLNYQLGRELVVSQRIGHQVVLAEGLTVLVT